MNINALDLLYLDLYCMYNCRLQIKLLLQHNISPRTKSAFFCVNRDKEKANLICPAKRPETGRGIMYLVDTGERALVSPMS
jgi:hypothetical protein